MSNKKTKSSRFETSLPQLDKFIKLLGEKKNVEKDVLKLIDKTILTAERQLTMLRLRKDKMQGHDETQSKT